MRRVIVMCGGDIMEHYCVVVISGRPVDIFYQSLGCQDVAVHVFGFSEAGEVGGGTRPDVIVIDCGFSVREGLNLLCSMKSAHAAVPIIFITGISSEDIAIEAFRSGAREFVKQPIDSDELRESIRSLLKLKRESCERRRLYVRKDTVGRSPCDTPVDELPTNILNVVRYIEDNISDEIDLSVLAREASVSKYHFCKVFRRHFGMAPLKYVTVKRIEKAKRLLPRKDLNVSGVAYEVGFRDLSSFNRHFKRHTGMTPSVFRSSVTGRRN